jgi:mono/diheme cytochrome c family protein
MISSEQKSKRNHKKHKWHKTLLCLLCVLWFLLTGAMRQADLELPEGQGRQILENSCMSCHGLEGITKNEGLKGDGWKMIVDRMTQYGATVTGDQTTILVQYLADNFGEGRKVLDTSCTTCHSLNEVKKFQGFYKKDDWQDVVTTMVKYGADVKEQQVPVLVEFLTRTYGKK